jgi:ribosomal silencing factor RsfS
MELKRMALETRPLDRKGIRERVQRLYDRVDLDDAEPVSKFNLAAFRLGRPSQKPTLDLSNIKLGVEGIASFLQNSGSGARNIQTYLSTLHKGTFSAHIVLDLPSVSGRKALAAELQRAYRALLPRRKVPVDGGASNGDCDWIVLDLDGVFVHIFDPVARVEVGLDVKLQAETGI